MKNIYFAATLAAAGLAFGATNAMARCSTANLAGIWDVTLINVADNLNYWCAIELSSSGGIVTQTCEVAGAALPSATVFSQGRGCKIKSSDPLIYGATDFVPRTLANKPNLISIIRGGVGWYQGFRR